MKYKKIILTLLIVLIGLNISFIAETLKVKKAYKTLANDYNNTLIKLEEKSSQNKEVFEKEFDKYHSEKLKKVIQEDDLIKIAQNQWNYVITINGKKINANTIYTQDRNIKIVLAEFCTKEKLLPQDILIKGMLTGGDPNDKIQSHIEIFSSNKVNTYEENTDGDKYIVYEIEGISPGDIITLKMSPMLKDRLGLGEVGQDNYIEVVGR